MQRTRLYQGGNGNYHFSGSISSWERTLVRKPTFSKVYAVFNNYDYDNDRDDYTLRAVKILGVQYTTAAYDCILFVKVAGLGEGYISFREANLYASKEDYTNDKIISTEEMFGNGEEFNYFDALERLAENGKCTIETYDRGCCIKMYAWENNAPVSTTPIFFVNYDAVLDKFNVTIDPVRGKNFPYGTKEMAIADNTLEVCDFDDEDEKPAVYNLDVTISATIKVSAKNLSDANYKVLEMVKETSFANYHCVETRPKEY